MNKWISVEDRLPPYGQKVLAYWRPVDHKERPFHRQIIIAEQTPYGVDGDWWANGRNYDTETFITHWMPLPEPPEKGNES